MRSLVCLLLLAFSSLAPAQEHRAQRTIYPGFDRNKYPGDENLAALRRTFAFTGYWLNNPPGEASNTWKGKRNSLQSAGFGFAVLFNGKRFAQLRVGDAASMGRNDGRDAVATAIKEGFPKQTIIFLDQEEGGRLLPEQRAYLHAWVDSVNSGGFRSGVYCSGVPFTEGDGSRVVTAEDIRRNAEGRKIAYWVSNDACGPSPGCVSKPPVPSVSGVPFATIWQYAQSPRRRDMTALCAKTYSTDGECYPPGISRQRHLHIDLNSATSPDPSHGRNR